MSLFDWLRAKPACVLDATLQQRMAALPPAQPWQTCSLREQRWVVLDLETSGLNLNKDQVLSIGAVVIVASMASRSARRCCFESMMANWSWPWVK